MERAGGAWAAAGLRQHAGGLPDGAEQGIEDAAGGAWADDVVGHLLVGWRGQVEVVEVLVPVELGVVVEGDAGALYADGVVGSVEHFRCRVEGQVGGVVGVEDELVGDALPDGWQCGCERPAVGEIAVGGAEFEGRVDEFVDQHVGGVIGAAAGVGGPASSSVAQMLPG